MADKRKSERVDCFNNCLFILNDKTYKGILENISNTGASIVLLSTRKENIPVGSPCSLEIGNDSCLIPGRFTGKVIYSTLTQIGMQFQFSE